MIFIPLMLLGSISSHGAPAPATVHAIQGAQTVAVLSGKTRTRQKAGATLNIGDRVVTDAKTSAIITYPDNSQLIVGKNSDVAIEKKEQGGQWNRLHQGSVRAIVAPSPSAASKKFKFGVRTRAAVMGVRGTDFVVDADPAGKSEVHTLDGQVEVAKDDKSLVNGKGLSVAKDQFVGLGIKDKLPAAPRSFDSSKYLDEWKAKQPEMSELMKKAPALPKAPELPKTPALPKAADVPQPPAPPQMPRMPSNPFGR